MYYSIIVKKIVHLYLSDAAINSQLNIPKDIYLNLLSTRTIWYFGAELETRYCQKKFRRKCIRGPSDAPEHCDVYIDPSALFELLNTYTVLHIQNKSNFYLKLHFILPAVAVIQYSLSRT